MKKFLILAVSQCDRATFLAAHFNAKKIHLDGSNFEGSVGKYSFSDNKNKDVKLKKLKWGKYLINQIIKKEYAINFL